MKQNAFKNIWYKVLVKGVLPFYLFTFLPLTVNAQPKQRRAEQQAQQQKQQSSASSAMSMRAQISFPTAVEMPEEVVWRRDIYREISLDEDANGGLYYPVEPQGKRLNLFTYIFKLALNGYIPLYEYPLFRLRAVQARPQRRQRTTPPPLPQTDEISPHRFHRKLLTLRYYVCIRKSSLGALLRLAVAEHACLLLFSDRQQVTGKGNGQCHLAATRWAAE